MNTGLQIADADSARRIVPVGEFGRRIASLIERAVPATWVAGEISNLTRAASGHWYFSLKDREAQLRCVMFRSRTQLVDWTPREGDHVEARVLAGMYVPRGEFQLQVEQMRLAGAGALFEEFLRIKARLAAAGLFAVERKRALPFHPRRIGIVTSLAAAALRDVLATLARRAPHTEVLIYPTPVQGTEAPPRIVEALAVAARHGLTMQVDVILLVRGGGSIEDLWAFNDVRVAEAIAASPIPIVSGIGHETDFTIADFVSDVRAATPTAAAELASADASVLRNRLDRQRDRLARTIERSFNTWMQRIDDGSRRLRSPAQRLAAARIAVEERARRSQRAMQAGLASRDRSVAVAKARLARSRPDLDRFDRLQRHLRSRIIAHMDGRLRDATHALSSARERLGLLDPSGILERGYAIVRDDAGRIVRDADRLHPGNAIVVDVAHGRIDATVDKTSRDGTSTLSAHD